MPFFAFTVAASACLLFLVQPLIAKIILPWFGGTSAVWSAALVFFQTCLLLGYAYAHCLATCVRPRAQALIHGLLLLAACTLMPILPAESWQPSGSSDPTGRILLLLTATVGLPAFLLSSTSPLLQVWYMRWTGSVVPYWLFALSNFGSLIALLSFPLVLEPSFSTHGLAIGWSAAFVTVAVMSIGIAWMSANTAWRPAPVASALDDPAPARPPMGLWVLLSACASAMLVSVTAHLSTNVAPIPLLWVVPLALYLLTFILCFGNPRLYHRTGFFPLFAAALGGLAYLYTHTHSNIPIHYTIPLYLTCLFVFCMGCHGELVHYRPVAKYLTRFYLLVALGGALGGMFAAIVAPHIFATSLELPLTLIVMAVLSLVLQWHRRGSRRTLWLVRIAMLAGIGALVFHVTITEIAIRNQQLLVRRNFYGVLSVSDESTGMDLPRRILFHGTISHGNQFLDKAYEDVPGSYFSKTSGVGRALEARQAQGPIRFGVIGLGAGVLSSYARKGDYLRIYEINPLVLDIANDYFTFLRHARERGADVDVLLGDARLTLERAPTQNFDVLVVDAFSSDAIPTHLLTDEAMELYFRHLKPDGVLAVHISNRYLDLAPVCLRAAEHVHRSAVVLTSPRDGMSHASVWVLMTSNLTLLQQPQFEGALMTPAQAPDGFKGWTDQYSSVWPLLKLARWPAQ